jgi:hypothetical protein
MTQTVADVTWSPMPVAGMFIASLGHDEQGRPVSALVAGKRGDWSYLVQRIAADGHKVELLCRGVAETKLHAMRDVVEAYRGLRAIARHAGRTEIEALPYNCKTAPFAAASQWS